MNLAEVDGAGNSHRWGDPPLVPAADNPDGCDHNERTCVLCGLVKITIMPPQGMPWRAWRTLAGATWQGDATPPCLTKGRAP